MHQGSTKAQGVQLQAVMKTSLHRVRFGLGLRQASRLVRVRVRAGQAGRIEARIRVRVEHARPVPSVIAAGSE